jgi:hypothetical protein
MSDVSAFPMAVPENWDSVQDGMTLRDYFAGQALAGRLANSSTPFDIYAARYAYHIADVMLEARSE